VLGISLESARRLACTFELHRRIVHWSAPIRSIITTPENVLAVMLPFCTYQEERFWCLALDAGKRLICDPIQITMGDVDSCESGPRSFFRAAVKRGAVACVAVHNHPSSDLTISAADMAVTRRLAAAGRTLDVKLVDHIIVSDERRFVSLRQEVPDCFR
jgi:DNA repair protein RadC